MDPPSFDLVAYLIDRLPRTRFDLANSGLPAMSLDELGPLEGLSLGVPNLRGTPALREAVAQEAGVATEEVLATTGASEANLLVGLALLEPGDRVVTETPHYEPLSKTFRALGMRVSTLPRPYADGFRPSLATLDDLASPDLLVLTNLYNPGGTVLDRPFLREVAERAEAEDFYVLVDEIFREAALEAKPPCALTVSNRFVVTSGVSKVYGLASLRVGWCLAAEEVLDRIHGMKLLGSVTPSVASQFLAARALEQAERVADRNRRLVRENRKQVQAWVEDHDRLEWVRPACHVGFPRFDGDVDRLADAALEEEGVLIGPGRLFGDPGHFRIGFGVATETVRRGLEGLDRVLGAF